MRWITIIPAVALLLAPLLDAPTAAFASACHYTLGFKALHDLIPTTVGNCLVDEHHNALNGDALQETAGPTGAGGLLVWRKADNWTAYTDGYHTWINGPYGLQERLNTEQLPWEKGSTTNPSVPAVLTNPLADIQGWAEGKQLESDASSIGVTFSADAIPEPPGSAIFGYFDSVHRQIHINSNELSGSNDWAVAGILVHELRHASDYSRGIPMRDAANDCYSAEVRAFLTQDRWYQHASSAIEKSTGPIVDQLSNIDQEVQLLGVIESSGNQAEFSYAVRLVLDDWLGPYAEQCGSLP